MKRLTDKLKLNQLNRNELEERQMKALNVAYAV
jgi:natural product precursor